MKRKATGIYTTKGSKEQLVGHRAIIDGVLSVAIMKDNTVTSYVPLVEFMKQANTGQCINTTTNEMQDLTSR